jgi:hypothetical protein
LTLRLPDDAGPGPHEVTITVRAPGVEPVSRTVEVELRQPLPCTSDGGSENPCAVDLSAARNHDGTATVAASTEGNFDDVGWSYDADLLPSAGIWTWDERPYAVPEAGGTTANFVEARGQTLLLEGGARERIHLLGATHGGDVATALRLTYTDGTVTTVPVALTDWAAGGGRHGNRVAIDMPHRISSGSGIDGPPVQIFGASVPVDPSRELQSVTLPGDRRFEVFALTVGN